MQSKIVLYDIPGNYPASKAWSPNTWKVRYALNYKGIPLETVWVEYPDIEALYHKLGIEATSKNEDGSPLYTVPVIHDPSTDTTISESSVIVRYLDEAYPHTPVLLPKGTLAFHRTFRAAFGPIHVSVYYLVVYAVYKRLNQRSQVFFRATREKDEGKKLEEICGEEEWRTAEAAFAKLDLWLSANGEEGDELVMGDRICFADVMIVSCLAWAKFSLGEESEEWKRICGWNGGKWKRLSAKFAQYEVVDA